MSTSAASEGSSRMEKSGDELGEGRLETTKQLESECSIKPHGILRRPSSSSMRSEQDRLSIVSGSGDTLPNTISRRSSRVRFSHIEPSSPNVGSSSMWRRSSAESPQRTAGQVGRIRPSSLPLPASPGFPDNADFSPKALPTPQHSPTRSSRSGSLRSRSSREGLRADLDSHRLSTNIMSRRSLARFPILVDTNDVELLAEVGTENPEFSPLPLRYPSCSMSPEVSVSTRPLSFPSALPLPPLPSSKPPTRPVSLPLPMSLPPLPSLEPPTKTLSPIVDTPSPRILQHTLPSSVSVVQQASSVKKSEVEADPVEPADNQFCLIEDSVPPTGRSRETTTSSNVSLGLGDIAFFPVPSPRIHSTDTVTSLVHQEFTQSDFNHDEDEIEATTPLLDQEDAFIATEAEDMVTDEEAIIEEPTLGSSPELHDLVEQMKTILREDGEGDSEIDLSMSLNDAAIKAGIISASSRLLRPRRPVSSLGIPRSVGVSRTGMTRSASYNGPEFPSSDSEDEEFARIVRSIKIRKLARTTYLRRKQEEADRELLSPVTPNKRMSNISASSCSSTDLLTPDQRYADLDIRSPAQIAHDWATGKAPNGCALGIPDFRRLSLPAKPGRPLPYPRRQVKGWGPPEIMIYEESDDEPVALSSSDDEEILPPADGSFRMSVHYNFDKAKKRASATASLASSIKRKQPTEDNWLMNEELPEAGEESDFGGGEKLKVPTASSRGGHF